MLNMELVHISNPPKFHSQEKKVNRAVNILLTTGLGSDRSLLNERCLKGIKNEINFLSAA